MWPTDVPGEANPFLSMALKVPSLLRGKGYSLITFIRHHVPSKNQHLALTHRPGEHFKRRVLQQRMCLRCDWPDLRSSCPQRPITFGISQWGKQDAGPATAPWNPGPWADPGQCSQWAARVSHINLGTHLLPDGVSRSKQGVAMTSSLACENTMSSH